MKLHKLKKLFFHKIKKKKLNFLKFKIKITMYRIIGLYV